MKTPEEIKNGLECCTPRWVANHWKSCSSKCPYITLSASCRGQLVYDALAYIQQLENQIGEFTEKVAQLDQVTRERDALLEIVKELGECAYCKHDSYCTHTIPDCMNCKDENCKCYSCGHQSKWQWRGEQEGE